MIPLIVFSTIGTALIISGYKYYSKRRYLLKHGIRTEGRVRGYEVSSGKYTTYYPIVSYKDHNGEVFEQQLDFGYSFKPWKKGEVFEILYDAENPSDIIKGGSGIFSIGPHLLIIGGVVMFIGGLLSYLEIIGN